MEDNRTMNNYGGLKTLQNPDETPMQVVLTGTSAAGAGTTSLFFDDSCALAAALGLVGGAAGVEMTVQGAVTETNLKRFLQSYAIIVCGFNFDSTSAATLTNNLQLIHSKIDADSKNRSLFSSLNRSNMQFDAELLNNNMPFVWTSTTALKTAIPSVAGGGTDITYTFTFSIAAIVPYGQLDEWLQANPMKINGSKVLSC